jgi:hypothetical protein
MKLDDDWTTYYTPEDKAKAEMVVLRGGPMDGLRLPALPFQVTITTPVYDGTKREHRYVRGPEGFRYIGIGMSTEEEA